MKISRRSSAIGSSSVALTNDEYSISNTRSISPVTTLRRKPTQSTPFKKKICGDIFGTSMTGENSMLGMLYRSRIQESLHKSALSASNEESKEEGMSSENMSNNLDIVDGSSDSDNDVDERMNPRQRLALTIRNWSVLPENDSYLLREGAVHAIVALAGTEDHRIKQYCASTLFHLSSRAGNREELLSLGAATGVITIAMSVRHWKIAKLCALTLCNLSNEDGGESIMAKEGAVLALVILLGVRNQRLAPVCVQALHNLTCVDSDFKGMERIIKALLNLPPLPTFDATPYVVKSLVNCSRFAWLRMRIIEDGALQTFTAFVSTISHRENRSELVHNMATCLRQLSDSVGCRVDMISKGSIEMLPQLLPYCDENSRLLLMKSLHNLLGVVSSFPSIIFEMAVNVVIDMVLHSDHVAILQYASSAFYIFTKEKMHGLSRLTIRVLKALPKLLASSDPLTQFFSVITSANMFFQDLCEDSSQLEGLLRKFVEAGDSVDDTSAVQVLVIAMAMLSQQEKYVEIIAHHGLLDRLLDQLLRRVDDRKDDLVIREAACVAICRISLRLMMIDANKRRRVAAVLFSMLETDELVVLESVIAGIRALAENGLCHKEFLSDELILRIAEIALRYKNEISICRMCCAVLAVLSYDVGSHSGLSSDTGMHVLFTITRSDDINTREFVATCICNISIEVSTSMKMIEKGVVEVISSLSGATSERIQELCAKCICNLTCAVDMHRLIISHKVQQTILMISLVRSVSETTKRLCARSLLNMLLDEHLIAMLDAGVIRAFSTLSLIPCAPTQQICARAFLIFTCIEKGREEIVHRRAVLHSLFGLVKCESMKSKILVGKAVCNLLACASTRKVAIVGGALSVLKIVATLDVEELRESVAKILIIMAKSPSLYDYLLREPVVPVLLLILQKSSTLAFECALHALSCLSVEAVFRPILIEKGSVAVIVGVIMAGKVHTNKMAEEVCRCFCYLSFLEDHAESVISSGNILLGLHAIFRRGLATKSSAEMIAIILKNLTNNGSVCHLVVEQDGVQLLRGLMDSYKGSSFIMCKAIVLVLQNLCREKSLHESIMKQGLMSMIYTIAVSEEDLVKVRGRKSADFGYTEACKVRPLLSPSTMLTIVSAIDLISESSECREDIVNGKVIRVFTSLLSSSNDTAKHEMANSIANMASTKECRDKLVEQNTVELLIALSKTPYMQTRMQCALALGYLSEYTHVKKSTVASVLLLSLKAEEQGVGQSGSYSKRKLFDVTDLDRSFVTSSTALKENANQSTYGSSSTKSLRVMLKDGLLKNISEHGVNIDALDGVKPSLKKPATANESTDVTANIPKASRHMSTVQISPVSTLNRTVSSDREPDEGRGGEAALVTISRQLDEEDVSEDINLDEHCVSMIETIEDDSEKKFEYRNAVHHTNQESGGMAKKLKVDLPYPKLPTDRYGEPPDRVRELFDIPVVMTTLPKDRTVVDVSKNVGGVESLSSEFEHSLYLTDNSDTIGGSAAVTVGEEVKRDRYGRKKSHRNLNDRMQKHRSLGRHVHHDHTHSFALAKQASFKSNSLLNRGNSRERLPQI